MSDEAPIGFLLGVFLSFVLFVPIMLFTEARLRDRFEREAVNRNAATWTVDENGNRVFKWKGQE